MDFYVPSNAQGHLRTKHTVSYSIPAQNKKNEVERLTKNEEDRSAIWTENRLILLHLIPTEKKKKKKQVKGKQYSDPYSYSKNVDRRSIGTF